MPKDEGEVIIKNYDYPMADEELKNTMNSYLENNCPDLKNYVKTINNVLVGARGFKDTRRTRSTESTKQVS